MSVPEGLDGIAGRLARTRRPYLLLVVFCGMLWLPGVLTIPASDRDESRFAQASKQMLETGDFVRIQNGAEARNRKPIGIHWLQVPFAAVARTAGLARDNPIWPYRLPSLLGGLGAVLAVFGLWRQWIGEGRALLAAGMLASSVIMAVETVVASTDAALLGVTTVAMGLLGRAYLGTAKLSLGSAAAFWLAIGAGILLKGPITPLVAGLAASSLVIADRTQRGAGWLRRLHPGWGVPLMLLAVLPWFAAIGIATHGAFFRDAVGGDLVGKLAGGNDGHGAPPGLHLLLLPALAFPGSLLVLRALPGGWSGRNRPVMRFLAAWIVPFWLVCELVPTKLPHYPLPLYPALFLLAACWAADPSRELGPRWWARPALTAFTVAAAAIGLGAAALPFAVAPGFGADHLLGLPALVAATLACAVVARQARRRSWPRAAAVGVLAAPLLVWSILAIELPRLSGLWIAPRVEAVLRAHWGEVPPAGAAFGSAGFHEPSLMFLCGTQTRLIATGRDAARFLAENPDAVVAVGERDLRAFRDETAEGGFVAHELTTVTGYNYSRGRREALSIFAR